MYAQIRNYKSHFIPSAIELAEVILHAVDKFFQYVISTGGGKSIERNRVKTVLGCNEKPR
jgi:hypothetical protein